MYLIYGVSLTTGQTLLTKKDRIASAIKASDAFSFFWDQVYVSTDENPYLKLYLGQKIK